MRSLYIVLLAGCLLAGGMVGYRLKPAHKSAQRVLYYQDPMHPGYRSSKPGIAPDCGMELTPVYAGDLAGTVAPENNGDSATPAVGPSMQRLLGIRVARATMETGQTRLRLFARVEPDETRQFRLEFGTDGYVKETHDDALGSRVSKGQRLATAYSPEFLSVAGGYLAANERTPGIPATPRDGAATNQGAASAAARADRLRNLGMSDAQLEEITKNHKLPEDIYVVSPVDGFIVSRRISPGMRFERHDELYTIADLSRVWIEAEAYGSEAARIHAGQKAHITIPDLDLILDAPVALVLPEADASSRAFKVRLEVSNAGYKLRPGMYASVEIAIAAPSGLTVPVDAVVDSGALRRVFVRTDDQHFAPRIVRTGWQLGDRIEVVDGLREGEMVVDSGAFLIDSEARLREPVAKP